MAMGIKHGKAEINVTPMIDVLLVLLIIFMVVQEHSVGLDVQLPQDTDSQGRLIEALAIGNRLVIVNATTCEPRT